MPLYEFRCDRCGVFEQWRTMADSSNPAACPSCQATAKRIFSPPAVLSGSLRLKKENPEPQLVKRDQEPERPRVRSHTDGRPWMISH
ncbi:zinc ribbon domain-containing protein [Chroococcidiopsis sp. CCMEE 29]|uniref:FmdB family zinc ribbon protein n=1 Tax=Chroococcidiopsis sp. CCMEE 29 TaxID=155894 RepID=UPI0020214BAF|nr:zinc ribbon domain-containing protein [Chroococcidiopsis sp. CCMEE 29]